MSGNMAEMRIRPYYGEFLLAPWPLHLDLPPCGYNCAYCFAKLRRSNAFVVKPRDWRAYLGSRTNYLADLIRRKSVVCVSNTSDFFSPGVHEEATPLVEAVLEAGLPIAWQTRGGAKVFEWLKRVPKANWYISVTHDQKQRTAEVESVTPGFSHRLRLIEALREHGHTVVVGVNPYIPAWWADLDGFLRRMEALDVAGLWIEALHLPPAFARDAMPDFHRRAQPVAAFAKADKPDPDDVTARTSLPCITWSGNSPHSRAAEVWRRATDGIYAPESMYPTFAEFRATLADGDEFDFAEFCDFVLPRVSKALCSQIVRYVSSTSARTFAGTALRAYSVREVLRLMWESWDAPGALWNRFNVAPVGSESGDAILTDAHGLALAVVNYDEALIQNDIAAVLRKGSDHGGGGRQVEHDSRRGAEVPDGQAGAGVSQGGADPCVQQAQGDA